MKKSTQLHSFQLSRLFPILIVFFTLMGTQFMLPLDLMGRTIYLYYAEILMAALFAAVMLYMLIKRQKPVFTTMQWLLPAAFIVWFVILTAYRFVTFGDLTGGFINFRVLIFPILLVLALKQLNASKKDIMYGIFLFATVMNIYQVCSVFISHSFRAVLALQNINIYLCFMLAVLPLLFMMLKHFTHKSKTLCILMRILLVFNILSILVFTFFSGSRLAIAVLPISFVAAFLLIFGFSGKAFLKLGALLLAFIVVVTVVLSCNTYDSRYNVSRTYAEVFSALNIRLPDKNPAPAPDPDTPAVPDTEKPDVSDQIAVENNVSDSNTMRELLWEKSIAHIKESPFWGRTSVDVEIEMNFIGLDTPVKVIQSPHNFILEGWMALGLPGLLLYGAIIITAIISILRKKIKLSAKITLFVILFAVFGFSFFQPLVTCYFAISLILWFVLYLYSENDAVTIPQKN